MSSSSTTSSSEVSLQATSRRFGVGLIAATLLGCDGGREGPWIAAFEVAPSVIHIDRGESARISFVIRDRRAAAAGFARASGPGVQSIESYVTFEGSGHRQRTFLWSEPKSGYKVAIWDGTFADGRSRPPATGSYRVWVIVTDESGHSERFSRRINVVNPGGAPVLPRTNSGRALRELAFDGARAVLVDEGGNSVHVRAVSGLLPHNPENNYRLDYTRPVYQAIPDRGPIPEGEYFILRNAVQYPNVVDGEWRYPSGAEGERWGPLRARLRPMKPGSRDDFFLHLDIAGDGTAGCIGAHPDDEAKFNQMMALIHWMTNDTLKVTVDYPNENERRLVLAESTR